MNLSNELLKRFAKITAPEKTKRVEQTTYGTVRIIDGSIRLVIDGSSIATSAESTIEVENGDRVVATIKNHSVLITGKLSKNDMELDKILDSVYPVGITIRLSNTVHPTTIFRNSKWIKISEETIDINDDTITLYNWLRVNDE